MQFHSGIQSYSASVFASADLNTLQALQRMAALDADSSSSAEEHDDVHRVANNERVFTSGEEERGSKFTA